MNTKRQCRLAVIVPVGVNIAVPFRPHELMLEASLQYYGISQDDLFNGLKTTECSRRRGMLYYLTKQECLLNAAEIANIYETTRQNVESIINTLMFETQNYLQITCEYENIKKVWLTLQKEQDRWLDSHKNNMMRSISQ